MSDFDTQIGVFLNDQASKQYAAMVAAINKSTRQLVDVNGNVISSQKAVTETTKQVAAESKKSQGVFDKMTGSVKSLVGAYVGMQGIRMAAGFLMQSARAATEAEQASVRLEAVLRATGKGAQISSEAIDTMAKSLAKVTIFDDDAIKGAQAMLLEFDRIGADTLPQATRAMLDMATRTGDLTGSAMLLGKALQGEEGSLSALRRQGVVFNDEQIKMIEGLRAAGKNGEANAIIFKKLEGRIGGVAEAAGASASGQLLAMKNELGNIQEEIGARVIPALNAMGRRFIEAWDIVTGKNAAGSRNIGLMTEAQLTVTEGLVAAYQKAASDPNLKAFNGMVRQGAKASLEAAKNELISYTGEAESAGRLVAARRKQLADLKANPIIDKPTIPKAASAEKAVNPWADLDMSGIPELAWLKQRREQEEATQQAVVDGIQARIKANQELQDQQAKIKSDKEDEIKLLEEEMRLRREGANDFVNNLETMAKGSRKFSIAYKTAAISETIISTWEAAQHAFKWGMKYGGPVAPFLAGGASAAAVGAGFARVNAIREQKFAQGGDVIGPSSGDQVHIRANGGEHISTKQEWRQILSSLRSGPAFAPVIQIYGASDAKSTAAAVGKTIQEATRDFARMTKRMQMAMV